MSSKVTVEYHDPSGIFPLISRDLASRLPLRNLNWKSPSRPLRSIGALHVEFVPDAHTEASDSDKLQRVDSYGSTSGPPSLAKERRHQIPGLRQTPYLRIFLLRCDDKDTYKASSRQLLRDWLNQVAQPSQSSSAVNRSEDHDAAEWLILHVVIPDTIAASEPRWTAASNDELVERPSSTTKWPGKSSRTVLDKIRADFTASTKSGPERIAQIRLQKKDVPPQLLPQTPVTQPYIESPQEQDNAWQDLVAKFKTLILMSFDLRVLQYEDDIREKDSQRALPGWNFCTFFTLKEGLARGFESVGLVEDALAIYDELSAGLESALRDNEPGAAQGTFLGDLAAQKNSLLEILNAPSDASKLEKLTSQFRELSNQPLDLTNKDYRGEIVSSTISLFDFRLYIFARQRTLLLRLSAGSGTFQQARPSSARENPKDDNLTFAAEVCKRAALFAATNARALRNGLTEGSKINSHLSSLVENIASSWTYAVLEQVLGETASKEFPSSGDKSSLLPQNKTPGVYSKKEAGGNFNFPQGANTHPTRSSSLQRSASSSSQLTPQTIYENERYSKSSPNPQQDSITTHGSGIAVLASGRAQLLLMQRRIIEALAKQKGWLSGWAAIKETKVLADIDLDDKEEVEADEEMSKASISPEDIAKIATILLSAPLSAALASLEEFKAAYEQLSTLAASHFTTANHTKSADCVLCDLAILKYQLGDVAQAATYFQRSSSTFAKTSWSYVHAEMLRIYAKCLKDLHRRDEYMRVMLSLLGKVVTHRTTRALPRVRNSSAWLDEETVDVSGVLGELVSFSDELPYNFTTSMSDFFAGIEVGAEIVLHPDQDGFGLNVRFKHLLDDDLKIDRVRLRLVLVSDASQEILLQSDGPVELKRGLIELQVHSKVTTYGHYLIDKLVLESRKLHFSHDFQPKPQTTPLGITNANVSDRRSSMSGPSLLLYPHGDSLEARAALSNEIHIDRIRSIVLTILTGRNKTESLDLRLKSASAGLRLHTADAAVIESDHSQLDTSQAGMLRLGAVEAGAELKIRVPYSTERSLDELTVKLEASYQTSQGTFSYLRTSAIPAALPLDVDVNDIFKSRALFSRFSVRTTNAIPLKITKVQIEESQSYGVRALPCPLPMTVFDKQPASLTYKITRKEADGSKLNKKEAALALTVEYTRSDEAIFEKLGNVLETAVANSPFASLRRLLVPTLLNRARSHAPAQQLEQAVLLNEFQVPSYETTGWGKIVASLTPEKRQGLDEWLQEWHSNNQKLVLDESAPASLSRRITLSVEVPTVDVLHSVTLRLDNDESAKSVIIGRPLPVTLSIKHTRRWAQAELPSDTPLAFSYTIDAPMDGPWLVAGPKRSRFTYKSDDEETKISLVLVALRPGMHLLPSVDIQPVTTAIGNSDSSDPSRLLSPGQTGGPVEESTQPLVSCETDYCNSGETILVVREARTTTVTVRERDLMPALQRIPTATESVRASGESVRTSRLH